MAHWRQRLLTCVLAVLCALPVPGMAQDEAAIEIPRTRTSGVYVGLGASLADLDELNERLDDFGFPAIEDYSYSLSAGFFSIRWRIMTGFQLMSFFWPVASGDDAVSQLHNVSGTFQLGVNVLPDGWLRLYPYVGAGLGWTWLRLREESASFEQALNDEIENTRLSQYAVPLKAGVGVDFAFGACPETGRNRFVGLQVEYIFDPSGESKWRAQDVSLSGDPDMSMSGVRATVTFGRTRVRYYGRWRDVGGCPGTDLPDSE